MIGGIYELIIQGSYSKNHYKKVVNSMINTKSKLIGGSETKEEDRRISEEWRV